MILTLRKEKKKKIVYLAIPSRCENSYIEKVTQDCQTSQTSFGFNKHLFCPVLLVYIDTVKPANQTTN